jgi:hypothetical protein
LGKLRAAVPVAADEVERAKWTKQKIRVRERRLLELTVEAVLSDVAHSRLYPNPKRKRGVRVSRDTSLKSSRYVCRVEGFRIEGKQLPKVLDALHDLRWIEQTKGTTGMTHEARDQTILLPGERLLAFLEHFPDDALGVRSGQEIVLLKSTKDKERSNLKEYDDTELTNDYRAEVVRINDYLSTAEIAVHMDGVDGNDRRLRRAFTCGSFESGGRLSGGFWMGGSYRVTKDDRRRNIEIDGERVAELDFQGMQVSLCYAHVGATPPSGDPYALPGCDSRMRDPVKRLFASMLFDLRPRTRWPEGFKDEYGKLPPVKGVIRALMEKHPALAPLFFTGIGHRLQFTESEILIDVLLALIDMRITALPIHDCVIVAASQTETAERAMIDTFYKHTGVIPGVTRHGL